MSLLVTGSIGIDTVSTPFGVSENCLGGSAVYFSLAACCFTPVRMLGVIGSDCPFDLQEVFMDKNVDLSGLEIRPDSKTFRWKGSYTGSMNEAFTDDCQLNVLAEQPPAVPQQYIDSEFVFLANTAPNLQMELLEQLESPVFVAADTMNLWIQQARDDLEELLDRIDMLVLNDGEARLLTGRENLVLAGEDMLKMGPRFVIIKKGEHGSMMFSADGDFFVLPAYSSKYVVDPTGAGDSFAGAVMGYLASLGRVDSGSLRNAIVYGTVAASFTISDFSIHGLKNADIEAIEQRVSALRNITCF